MKNFFIFLFFLIPFTWNVNSQTETLIASDYIETYDWFGAWYFNNPTTGYFTDISVTPTTSAAIYGSGNNTYEQDWYALPTVNVDPTKDHIFRMRLAAQTISSPGATTAGLDGGDYIIVQLSKDGGSFVSELRVTGFSNATWDYSSTAVASKVSDGSITTFQPSGGGDRTSLGDGYSYIELTIPPGPSSIAIDVYCRANRAGEDWWMDNFELVEIPNNPLPVTLTSFTSSCDNGIPVLNWSTASEQNSNYFQIERSQDGFDWNPISQMPAAGNSSINKNYQFYDMNAGRFKGYYRLKQVDFNGQFEYFSPKYSNCAESIKGLESEVFPNPTIGEFFIGLQYSQEEDAQILITDNSGRIILQEDIQLIKGYVLKSVNLSTYQTGVYQIYITTLDHKYIHKVIKK